MRRDSAAAFLDRREEHKKRLRQFAKVDTPQTAFIEALKTGD